MLCFLNWPSFLNCKSLPDIRKRELITDLQKKLRSFLNWKSRAESRAPCESQWAKLSRAFAASDGRQASTQTTNSSKSEHILQQQELEELEKKVNDLSMARLDLQQMKLGFMELDTEFNTLKADFAKYTGYSLAVKLIDIVSELCGPNQEESLTSSPKIEKMDPWKWMTTEQDFIRVTDDNPQLLPQGISSVEEIALTAANIKAMHHGQKHKSDPEKLYLELKLFKARGYLETLQNENPELHDFLSLSELIGYHFIAGPRILQLIAHMFMRARMDIERYKLSSEWQDRWQNTEAWFATVLDNFRERILQRNPEIGRELAKECYLIEQFCSRTKPNLIEAYSWEKIVQLFTDVQKSGLLTPEIRRKFILSCILLDCALEIRDKYINFEISEE